MRADRLLSILILLQVRGRMTASALARELETSLRTIYRDVDALSAAGVPIYGDRGHGGGFALLEGYRTRLTGLSTEEAEAVTLIGMIDQARALGLGAAAARAKEKVIAALPSSSTKAAQRISSRFHVDPAGWYQTEARGEHLSIAARAVLDGRRLSMTYESWNSVLQWTVDPRGMVLKGGVWYLVAEAGGKRRILRIDAIREAQILDDPVPPVAEFDLASWWTSQVESFEKSLRPGRMRLSATTEGLRRLGELGAYARNAINAAAQADGASRTEVVLPYETPAQAARMVLSLGGEATVVEPPEVVWTTREMALAAAQAHSI